MKTYTLKTQADFEALKSLPRPSTFAISFEGEEGALTVNALLSCKGEVWAVFPHDPEVVYHVRSFDDLAGDGLDYEDFTLPFLASLFGHG